MTIDKISDGTVLTMRLEGRLDTTTAPALEDEVKTIDPAMTALVLDLAKLDYISSAGLRVILAAHKQMAPKDGMVVRNAQEPVMEIFEVTGFSDILNFG